jgi:hypothetical protein
VAVGIGGLLVRWKLSLAETEPIGPVRAASHYDTVQVQWVVGWLMVPKLWTGLRQERISLSENRDAIELRYDHSSG